MNEYHRLKKMKEEMELAARSEIEKDRDALKIMLMDDQFAIGQLQAENKRLRDAIKAATDLWCIKPTCRCFLCETLAPTETKTKEEE